MTIDRPFPQELWDQTPGAVQDDIRALEARVAALEVRVRRLEATVRHVTEQLPPDSRTSSRPPSSDPPQAAAKRPQHGPSHRRPGGQPGHEGHARALVPLDAVGVVGSVKPERCRRCQPPVAGEDPPPQRPQVTDSPAVQPVVTASQLHRLVCSVCGDVTQAEVPAGVPTGSFGPRVQAIAALCTGAYHLSKRTTQSVLEDRFGIALGVGTSAHLAYATVQAVAEPVADARGYVPRPSTAPLDETGWREGRQRAWLWTAVTAGVTVLVVRLSRSAHVAQALLGEHCWGDLVTDRWSAYTWSPAWRRQVCWAQLLRDSAAMSERGGASPAMGEALRGQARQRFHWWHRVRDGTLAPTTLASDMGPVRREVERWLEAGQTWGVPKTAGTCREILTRRQAWWTFVRHPEVEPTNHAAERAIRPGVLWRKGRFGTQRAQGSRVVEAMMTVVTTLKQQHRHVLDDLTTACEAALRGEAAPGLLPSPAQIEPCMRPAA